MSRQVVTRAPKNPDHPFTKYLQQLREKSIDMDDYRRRKQYVADTLGIKPATLFHLSNPNSHGLNLHRALTLELLSEGAVPAESVCASAKEILDLAERVLDARSAKNFT